ncbi:hypothetical protein [Dyadobacter chenhuakuii]|uniref:Uncharacterized protein n=1 Tax=Dyadobacter chenhuakuii TaxID=2909339 RepID=A0A9X1QC93_9BACT|nr:hypothetical protein [Dyadobacter chenhuakuii]MCF2498389.1 hypothetical protein [Dyadobacter chenhuakuii]
MTLIKASRKISAPATPINGEIIYLPVNGSYVQYIVNNAGLMVPPAVMSHGHGIGDVTGLQTALDGKAAFSHSHANATPSVAGFMSAADKTKLDESVNYTHPFSGVDPGSYGKVTVNAFGHVTGGSNPVTLGGYGISEKFVSLNPTYGEQVDNVNDVDLNTVTVASSFFGGNLSNKPVTAASSGFVTTLNRASVFMQTYFDSTTQGAFYFRRKNSGVFYPWEKVATESWVASQGFLTSNVTSALQDVLAAGNSAVNQSLSIQGVGGTTNYIARFGTSGGWFEFFNGTTFAATFLPTVRGTSIGSNKAYGLAFIGQGQDDYLQGAVYFSGRNAAGTGMVTSGNIASFANFTTQRVSIAHDGAISAAGVITAVVGNSTQWSQAFGWGNHSSAGYALNSSLSGYVPTSRTITINGTSYDLSANRSWTIPGGGIPVIVSNGYLPLYDGVNNTFVTSSIQDSTATLKILKDFTVNQNGAKRYIEFSSTGSAAGLNWYTAEGTLGYSQSYSSDGSFKFTSPGGNVMQLNASGLVEFLKPNGATPFLVNSNTVVSSLNADMLDGFHASSFLQSGSITLQSVLNSGNTATNQTIDIQGPAGTTNSIARFGANTGYVEIYNGTSFAATFLPTMRGISVGVNSAWGVGFIGQGQESYTQGAITFSGRNAAGNGEVTGGNLVSFRNYTSEKLAVGYNGNLTAAGVITAVVGNSTQWSQAFGWGNHASAGYTPSSRTISINGTTYDLSANRSWSISGGSAYSAASGIGLSGTTFFVLGGLGLNQEADGLSIDLVYTDGRYMRPGQTYLQGALSISGGGFLGSGNYYLTLVNDSSSPGSNMLYGTDAFGNKGWYTQPSGAGGGVSGSGGINYLPLWSGSTSLTSSVVTQVGSFIVIGSVNSMSHLYVQGSLNIRSMTQSQRISFSPGYSGAMVYQSDGMEGLYMFKTGGWVYIG